MSPRFRFARIFLTAAAALVVSVADLPRLPFVGIDLGASPAFAKGGRGDRGDRGNRGRGQERRLLRGADGGSLIRSRPGRPDHAGNGWHRGHDRGGAVRAAAPPEGIIPPRRPQPDDDGFRNHGDRVSTFVALAKSLGFSASVGAMQANFGTPFENDLVAIDPDTGEYFVAADADEIAAVKPGEGPKSGWETETALDVNMDGTVDRTDLDQALADGVTVAGDNRSIDDDDNDDNDPEDEDPDDVQAAILRLGREGDEAAF